MCLFCVDNQRPDALGMVVVARDNKGFDEKLSRTVRFLFFEKKCTNCLIQRGSWKFFSKLDECIYRFWFLSRSEELAKSAIFAKGVLGSVDTCKTLFECSDCYVRCHVVKCKICSLLVWFKK
jgi:hypothetical protein